jgi:urocanate hydratase
LELPHISRVYAQFVALTASSDNLGGSLLFYSHLNANGISVAIASNIAGAASLGLEPDVERAKAALRAGICDFLVNNLDEALRILKNEIRKRRAVAVVLIASPDAAAAEMLERGVQPEILTFSVPELLARGSRLLESGEGDESVLPIAWSAERESARWLPILDGFAAGALVRKDARNRWIESAPRSLGRAFAGQRYMRMSEAEASAFIAAIRGAVHDGKILVPISVTRGNETIRVQPISAAD